MRHRIVYWALLAVGLTAGTVGGHQLWSPTAPSVEPVVEAGVVPAALAPHRESRPAPQGQANRPTPAVAWIPGPPVKLEVAALNLQATIDPVGVRAGGAVVIPRDVATVGWVATTARPGLGLGTTTLIGHVDDIHGHYGVLHRLYEAKVGQHVTVRTATGDTVAYVIRAVRLYPRSRLPADLFTRQGRPRLALVTCAGAYDHNRGGYQDNLVVWAVPSPR